MTSSRALELVYKLELKGDSCKQLDVTNCLGSCKVAKEDIIAILKEFAEMKDIDDKALERKYKIGEQFQSCINGNTYVIVGIDHKAGMYAYCHVNRLYDPTAIFWGTFETIEDEKMDKKVLSFPECGSKEEMDKYQEYLHMKSVKLPSFSQWKRTYGRYEQPK